MRILAINPWIYDFAAYDFWLKPYGFLVILSYLKSKGVEVDFIDCLDKKISNDRFGRGKLYSETIPKPEILKSIPRYFKRYGKPFGEVREQIKNKKPDLILITSSMTYWYPAIIEITGILKESLPEVPIILGGTYPTLCLEHARKNIGCNHIFKNNQIEDFFGLIKIEYDPERLYTCLPEYEKFYSELNYVVLRTSWGCTFDCSYCAIKELFGGYFRVSENEILRFILSYHNKGIKDFVFYDEALLYEKDCIKSLLNKIAKTKIDLRFHTPNALHIRFLDEEIARLLKSTGFINPHFGLETLNPRLQKIWGDKANNEDVQRGIKLLKQAGFKNGQFSLYILLGFPNQDFDQLKKEVEFLHSQGARVSLAEFSITPRTRIFQEYKDKFSEPLLHNNSIFSFFPPDTLGEFYRIKNYVRQLNKTF